MREQYQSREELLSALHEMNRRLLEMEARQGEDEWLEDALKRRTHELSERVKELECLHHLLQISLDSKDPLAKRPEDVLRVIGSGWQYPESTRVEIRLDEKSFSWPAEGVCLAHQTEPIVVEGKRRGEIIVGYTAKKPPAWQGPFLKEEAALIKSIALWLAYLVKR